jgi:hypothetical protein
MMRERIDPTAQPTLRLPRVTVAQRTVGTRLSLLLVIGLVLVNIVGFTGVWVASVPTSAKATSTDLTRRIMQMQTIMHAPDVLDAANFTNLQSELNAASADLQKLNGLLPFGGAIGTATAARLHHGFLMAQDFCQAVQYLISSVLTVEPGLRAFVYSLLNSTTQQGSLQVHLSLDHIHEAQRLLSLSMAAWNTMLAEQAAVGSAPLDAAFGISASEANTFLHYLSMTSSDYTHALSLVGAVLDNLFILLGIERPGNLFIGLLDTDQLRPVGGAIGSYAWVKTDQGAISQQVHFRDIATLDCPKACTANTLPPQYDWFTNATDTWGVRDGGLSQSIITSGYSLYQLIQGESNISADGMLLLTPKVLSDILRIMGPVAVPEMNATVTATNVATVLHQAHLQAVRLTQATGTAPALEAAIANRVFAALGPATNDQLSMLGAQLIRDLLTKDLQPFTIYDQIQRGLGFVGVEGIFPGPAADSLSIVDTNIGGDFLSSAVKEQAVDHITLSASGLATHAMTLTYTFTPAPGDFNRRGIYDDLVQVLAPSGATIPTFTGPCHPVQAQVEDRVDGACEVLLAPYTPMTLHVTWSVPQDLSNGYQLVLQRQAGAQQSIAVTVASPDGGALVVTSPDATVAQNIVHWGYAPLTQDRALFISLR